MCEREREYEWERVWVRVCEPEEADRGSGAWEAGKERKREEEECVRDAERAALRVRESGKVPVRDRDLVEDACELTTCDPLRVPVPVTVRDSDIEPDRPKVPPTED